MQTVKLKHNFPDKYINIEYFHPLSPNVHIHISPNWSVYISLKNQSREFHKRSKHFLFSDHFIISHNLISWKGMDIVGRKLMFVTIGTGNFFLSRKWSRRAIVWGGGGGGGRKVRVRVRGAGGGGGRKVFSLPRFSVPFSDSGTWFLTPGLLDSSELPCCLLNSFIYLNFMYFTIMTSKWTELIVNLPQEPQAIKPSKFSEYFVFMLQRFSTLVQNDEINIF